MVKTTTRWLLAGALCLALWPTVARAQSPELMAAAKRSVELRAEGRYQEAISLAEKALALGEREFDPDDPNTSVFLNNLAVLYMDQGRYAEAEPLHKRALAIDEKALGPDHPSVAGDLNNLAGLYMDQGRYADAEPLYQRALAIRETAFGPEHPDVAASVNNLAELYRAQGRYAEAEPLLKRALAIWETSLGPEHPNVAIGLNNLAVLYDEQGRYAEAEAQGRYAEAEPLFQRVLAIWETALGPAHPQVATGLNNLALLYRAQGRYADAAPLYQRARWQSWRKRLGKSIHWWLRAWKTMLLCCGRLVVIPRRRLWRPAPGLSGLRAGPSLLSASRSETGYGVRYWLEVSPSDMRPIRNATQNDGCRGSLLFDSAYGNVVPISGVS